MHNGPLPSVCLLVNVGFDGPAQILRRRWDGVLARHVRVATYQSLLVSPEVPGGVYVFTDLDRVPDGDRAGVIALWDALAASGAARLLNDPRRIRLRYDLLRHLFEAGLNDFNVYRDTDTLDGVRYPVFVRCEHDHGGPRTPLLENRAALDAALTRLRARRAWRHQLIVTESAAERDEDGLFRKYGAVLVDGRVIPWHVIASRSWLVKGESREVSEALREEQRRYVAGNPHAERIREAFALARIEYGRIDYAMSGDRMRVFEINTNPALGGGRPPSRRRPSRRSPEDPALAGLVEAFAALAAHGPGAGRTIPLAPRQGTLPAWAYRGLRHGQSLVARYIHRSGIR